MNNLGSIWGGESRFRPGVPYQGDSRWDELRETLLHVIQNAIDAGLPSDRVLSIAEAWNRQNGNPFPENDVRALVRWGWRKWATKQSSIGK